MTRHGLLQRSTSSGRCHWCNAATFPPGSPEVRADRAVQVTRDHIIPRAFGGTKTVIACHACNNARGHAPAEVWEYFMETAGRAIPANARAKTFREFQALLMMSGLAYAKREALRARPKPPVTSVADILRNVRERGAR